MSLGNDPSKTTSIEEGEAVAAASEARAELLIDGPAPSRARILEAMGRDRDGQPMPGVETMPTHRAGAVARQLLRGDLDG